MSWIVGFSEIPCFILTFFCFIAWLGSLAFGATFFFSPFSSVLCDMIPPSLVSFSGLLLCIFGLLLSSFATDISVLYLTYGLCFGIGASFTYFPTVIVLKKYFKRYLNLANGISASGSGLGTLVLGPLIEHSLECFGLHWMFRLCALAAALLIIVQMMFIYVERKFKSDIEVFNQDNFVKQLQKNICGKDLWSNRQYQIMIMSMAIFLFGYFVPYVHLVCKDLFQLSFIKHLQFNLFAYDFISSFLKEPIHFRKP